MFHQMQSIQGKPQHREGLFKFEERTLSLLNLNFSIPECKFFAYFFDTLQLFQCHKTCIFYNICMIIPHNFTFFCWLIWLNIFVSEWHLFALNVKILKIKSLHEIFFYTFLGTTFKSTDSHITSSQFEKCWSLQM